MFNFIAVYSIENQINNAKSQQFYVFIKIVLLKK